MPVYAQPYPPVLFARIPADAGGTAGEHLAAFVDGGAATVLFPAWAWQGLARAVHAVTSGAAGGDLPVRRALAVVALAPAAATPATDGPAAEAAAPLRYDARGGPVEIRKTSASTVTITCAGYPVPDGAPTRMTFPAAPTTHR